MKKLDAFQKFYTTQSVQVPVLEFFVNIACAALLAFLLGHLYVRYGKSLSNRKALAGNFVLLTTTTMLVISIVKASLALSLGLVGALSIVRFRSAIKEPEELLFLFLSLAIGLGFGADQGIVTVFAFLFIAAVIILRGRLSRSSEDQNLYLTVSSHNPVKVELEDVIKVLQTYCTSVALRRFDESGEMLEATFWVEFDDFEKLKKSRAELQSLSDSLTITFLDARG